MIQDETEDCQQLNFIRQLKLYMHTRRICAAINNGPPFMIHDPSNNTFHLVEVDKFHVKNIYIYLIPFAVGLISLMD